MAEEQEFKDFAAQNDVLQSIFSRMAPNIFGHDQIKKALACLLFGGARKVRAVPLCLLSLMVTALDSMRSGSERGRFVLQKLPDGTFRRGDVNVLLIGDPSTAKSQFLKFASKTVRCCTIAVRPETRQDMHVSHSPSADSVTKVQNVVVTV